MKLIIVTNNDIERQQPKDSRPTPMNKLILVKHSAPQIDPLQPSERWQLSEKGIALCDPLAERLHVHDIAAIVSSDEPKALQTAQLIGQRLGVAVEENLGLREHDRRRVPHLDTRDFISSVAQLFHEPDRRVLGSETANQARARFTKALDACLGRHTGGNLAVVSHGTVIALYLEQVAGLKGYPLWRAMGLPSFVVLGWPKRDVLETVTRIDEPEKK
jgi:broad specificity phosphatase PhoE